MIQIKVMLPDTEYQAIANVAAQELRDPLDQIRHVLRQDLARRGLLPGMDLGAQAQTAQAASPTKQTEASCQ